ncbi:hypothetical protein ACFL1H_03495 [Nanoarchaeota archaeon]
MKEDLQEIHIILKELETYSRHLRDKIDKKPNLDAIKITKTKQYLDFFNNHPEIKSKMIQKENLIEISLQPMPRLHQQYANVELRGGPGGRPRHSRIDTNWRIVYAYDAENNHLKYIKVIPHNQQDNLVRVNW